MNKNFSESDKDLYLNGFHDIDENLLISYGKLKTKLVKSSIEHDVDKEKKVIMIEGKCQVSEYLQRNVPKLFINCNYTRFGTVIKSRKNSQTQEYIFKCTIPISSIYKEIECRFIVHNKNYDIIQYSQLYKIEIEDELEQNFPNVAWRDFKIHFPEIKNLYWYIAADPDIEPFISFNISKSGFKKALETFTAPRFRNEYIKLFKQAYVTALIFYENDLSDVLLDELCNPDYPFHYRVAAKLLECGIHQDKKWERFAYLMQEVTNIRARLDILLLEESELY